MSSSKSSSSTRRNAARWISPSTNRNISSGIPDKISRSRCSSAEIRSCRVIFFFLGTKSPLSMDPRVVHVRPASKKKGPPLGPQTPAPAPRTGGAMLTRHHPPEPVQQICSSQNHCYVLPHGIVYIAIEDCLDCMRYSNLANCHHSAVRCGLRQRQPQYALGEGTPRIVHALVGLHTVALVPIRSCDRLVEIEP